MSLGRGAKALLLLAALVIVLGGLKLAADLVVPILIAITIAAATAPIAQWMCKRGVPTSVAVTITILGVLAGIAGFGWILVDGASDLASGLPRLEQRLDHSLDELAEWLYTHHQWRLGAAVEGYQPRIGSGMVASDMLSGAAVLVTAFTVVLFVVIFILLESATFRTKILRIAEMSASSRGVPLPATPRQLVHATQTVREVQKFLLVKTWISAATGALCAVVNIALGVDYPLLWGLVVFSLNFIPHVGGVISAVPPVVLAFANQGSGPAALVAAAYIAIHMVLGNIIEPRVMGRALGLSSLVVVVSMIFWGWLLGPVGALLSVPLTMVVKIVLGRTEDMKWVAVLLSPTRLRADGTFEVATERPSRTSMTPPAPESVHVTSQ